LGDLTVRLLRFGLTIACLAALAPVAVRAAEPFELKDGDRVVFVGSTLIESEQRYGYWETMLTSHFPDRNVTFRNLGWSGDTVFGDARAGFETQVEGYRRLKEHVLALKPTVIFIGYGTNESFEGESGLPRFVEGMNKLLDDLAPTKARIVLLSPTRQENLGRPLPDPTEHNNDLRVYCEAQRKIAAKRGCQFVDLFDLRDDNSKDKPIAPLTDNGIHLTPFGYWRTAIWLERVLGLKPAFCSVELNGDGSVKSIKGAKLDSDKTAPLRFQITYEILPTSLPTGWPKNLALDESDPVAILTIHDLAKGKYALRCGEKEKGTVSPKDGETLVILASEQSENLREKIIAKNRLYFHRWRPQNETYLYGFRRAEQGKNAKEIPEFDPLIEKLEAEIAKLRKPATQTWELIRKEEGKK
jgi:lysophospholipase L1-like esterase